MKLPEYVKPFPRLMLPTNRAEYGYVSYSGKYIYLSPKIYNDLLSPNPKPLSVSIFIHEQTHAKQIKKMGSINLHFKNTFSRKFRLDMELEAYKQGFSYLKKQNEKTDLDKIARDFSGLKYYYATSYENAKNLLEKAWEEA